MRIIMGRKRKISTEIIIEAVKSYLNNEGSKTEIARKYGMNRTYFRTCIAKYQAQGVDGIRNNGKNNVYSEETKILAVKAYLNGEGSEIEITARFGLRARSQLQNWIKVYNSGKGFRQKMSGGSRMKEARPTTMEERIQIAKDCIANGENYGETALKYNVSYQQVYQWVKKFKEKGNTGLEDRRGKRLKDQTPRTREEELEIEIAKLKHELYMTRMERDVLKKLDEIVRRDAYRK